MAKSRETPLPPSLPVMPLRSTIVYPLGVIAVQIGIPSTLEMLAANPEENLLVALVAALGNGDEPLNPKSFEKIGIAARVSDRLNMPGGTVQATVQGVRRIRLVEVWEENGFVAKVEGVKEKAADPERAEDSIARILTVLETMAAEVERISSEVPRILRMNVANPGRFADLVANLANFSLKNKDEVLQRLDVGERLLFVQEELERELRRLQEVEQATEAAEPRQPEQPATPAQHAADLRQQIKRLQAELGEVDPAEREAVDYFRRIEAANLPARVAAQARTEVERLRTVTSTSVEANEIRAYIDWILHMPWNRSAGDTLDAVDLASVQAELDKELRGIGESKDRLLDYLAVAKLRGDLCGPIPCLVGPPDVGKYALVRAFARGLDRPLASLELGGRGETDLIGTRRTRNGALPGKIAMAFRDVGVNDPLFLLEEIDEIGLGKVEGDPIEALEEALDWENRDGFVDRYLDLPFDLTRTVFVATAQDFYRVPRDLRELMVEIRLAGYTPEEKVDIAREHMLPRIVAEHGLEPEDVDFSEDSLLYIARGYARDAGLSLLRRSLATLLRTRARAKAQGELGTWSFTSDRIEKILGLPRYVSTVAESSPEVGVVTGLAWTSAGGELMFIEALRMPGSGRLIITGLLGDVMRESVNAAYSYVRSRGESIGIDDAAFRDADIHVHFPVGAIPKDGPSAGIAVTLAIASTLSNRPVRHDIAMTGEVTLRGKVLEIGGVKEKVLAAYRAGLRDVILPRGNERDLRDVPEDVRSKMVFHHVERMDDVLRLALMPEPVPDETDISPESVAEEPEPAHIGKEPRAAKES